MLQNNPRFLKICAIHHLADPTRNATMVCAGVCLTISEIRIRIVGRNAQ